MALVGYSDSEGSEDEQEIKPITQTVKKPIIPPATSSFTIDKTQPNKIKVNLQQKTDPSSNGSHEDEPATKRQRIGAGAFSGFNSMLPAPKRDNLPATQTNGSKSTGRKIFSLKTGAEAAFSRESDAEMKNLFAEQDGVNDGEGKGDSMIPTTLPKPAFAKPPAPATGANPFMFKPLSVARNQKKKKSINGTPKLSSPAATQVSSNDRSLSSQPKIAVTEQPKQKTSLFSIGADAVPDLPELDEEESTEGEHEPSSLYDAIDESSTSDFIPHQQYTQSADTGPQSLDTIASDLNLSKAERRQLFGRNNQSSSSQALNIVNFNTDAEYAANQQLIAAGETAQHNPVRAISSGKHSLKQLVSAASGQKEALEESFAQGRRNKREAGNKYGW